MWSVYVCARMYINACSSLQVVQVNDVYPIKDVILSSHQQGPENSFS